MLNVKMLNKRTINEIISVSNHKTEESIFKAFDLGLLEVYSDKKTYVDAGWNFKNKKYFNVLSDGKVVYFVD